MFGSTSAGKGGVYTLPLGNHCDPLRCEIPCGRLSLLWHVVSLNKDSVWIKPVFWRSVCSAGAHGLMILSCTRGRGHMVFSSFNLTE